MMCKKEKKSGFLPKISPTLTLTPAQSRKTFSCHDGLCADSKTKTLRQLLVFSASEKKFIHIKSEVKLK